MWGVQAGGSIRGVSLADCSFLLALAEPVRVYQVPIATYQYLFSRNFGGAHTGHNLGEFLLPESGNFKELLNGLCCHLIP